MSDQSASSAPSPWELSRGLEHVSKQLERLDVKVDKLTSVGVDVQLREVGRRLDDIERRLTQAASQRSMATWQIVFIVLAAFLAFGSALAVAVVR